MFCPDRDVPEEISTIRTAKNKSSCQKWVDIPTVAVSAFARFENQICALYLVISLYQWEE
uniref:Uncharacterized protein n=1 Tax=Tolypothrix bouteillei VB521301 TaxID=1479485 RepID=A0A0C1N4S6_9CYAN